MIFYNIWGTKYMKIKEIKINNFRKLHEDISIDVDLETLIVGKNNTGKTSIFEVVDKFLSTGKDFKMEDFNYSIVTKESINSIIVLYRSICHKNKKVLGREMLSLKGKELIEELFPSITMQILIEIDDSDNLVDIKGLLYEFDNNNEIIINLKYECKDIEKCIEEFKEYNYKIEKENKKISDKVDRITFYDFIKRNMKEFYSIRAYTTKKESNYLNEVDLSYVRSLFNIGIIAAQREVDDVSDQNRQSISNSIWNYYQKIMKESRRISEKDTFKNSISDIQENLNENYIKVFEELIEQINDNVINKEEKQKVKIISEFDIEDILKKNSKLRYYMDELALPESYNGLGYSNMMYMFIKIITYKEKILKEKRLFNILFIEEPESHLHPQMQQTFLKKIEDILGMDDRIYKIITTHSSYILQSADILSIRYFMNNRGIVKIKSLKSFFDKPEYEHLKEFIQKYFKINTCDLFFADKAILVEGTVERMLMPIFIKKYNEFGKNNIIKQHITTLEVGGAYAHIFNELLDFLELKTLIITDIDSVKGSHNSKCKCDLSDEGFEGKDYEIKTSNACIKDWFGYKGEKLYIKTILDKYLKDKDSILIKRDDNKKEIRRIAFQLPTDGTLSWGRTFEEQFIIENAELFSELCKNSLDNDTKELLNAISKVKSGELDNIDKGEITKEILKDNVFEIVDNIDKTSFSLDLLLFDEWEIPQYIKEGLEWLEK